MERRQFMEVLHSLFLYWEVFLLLLIYTEDTHAGKTTLVKALLMQKNFDVVDVIFGDEDEDEDQDQVEEEEEVNAEEEEGEEEEEEEEDNFHVFVSIHNCTQGTSANICLFRNQDVDIGNPEAFQDEPENAESLKLLKNAITGSRSFSFLAKSFNPECLGSEKELNDSKVISNEKDVNEELNDEKEESDNNSAILSSENFYHLLCSKVILILFTFFLES